MKYSKVLGLAAVAACALLAFAGAGAASATQICKRAEGGGDGKCRNGSSEKELAKGESFTATSTDLVLTSPTTEVACSSSSMTLRMTTENAISLIRGKVTALSFADCSTNGGTPCVSTVANLPYDAVLHRTDVILFDKAGGVSIEFECGYLESCEFTVQVQLIAAAGDLLVASGEIPSTAKGFCPVAARLDATYSARSGITFS